jgi:ATP-dependent Clp protease protease subunit
MKMSANGNNSADIFIYGEIVSYTWDEEDTSASTFKSELDGLGEYEYN